MKNDINNKAKEDLICGLIMPISQIDSYSKEHWEEVREIIEPSEQTQKNHLLAVIR